VCALATVQAAPSYGDRSVPGDGVEGATRPEQQHASGHDCHTGQDVAVVGADSEAVVLVPRAVQCGLGWQVVAGLDVTSRDKPLARR
jgi:hypothetical protein